MREFKNEEKSKKINNPEIATKWATFRINPLIYEEI